MYAFAPGGLASSHLTKVRCRQLKGIVKLLAPSSDMVAFALSLKLGRID
jgi:hypothetical protein